MKDAMNQRVRKAATAVLERDKSVGPIELLVELGFLHHSHVLRWRQQHPAFAYLSEHIQCGDRKLGQTWVSFSKWADENRLESFKVEYRAASREGAVLLKVGSDEGATDEEFFRTHFRSADLTEKQKERLEKKRNKQPDLVVFILTSESSTCAECGELLDRGEMVMLEKREAICLRCADLDHLVFLPCGDATLTRRSRKHSPLSAIVTQFNKRRKRYDRRGILVTAEAIDAAHAQNENDEETRARRREQAAERRKQLDAKLVDEMEQMIRASFPGCPPDEARSIATHTAERGSGRVGRSAAGRNLDSEAVALAVIARIRHQYTPYDELLMSGVERQQARRQIRETLQGVLDTWTFGS